MNIADYAFLLGQAHALLSQCRSYMIRKNDIDGIELIEDQYQTLVEGMSKLYYKNMELENGSSK